MRCVIGMASFPVRKEGMLQVVASLLPQCDKLCLYLNGYTERPSELPLSDKLVTVLGDGATNKDLGSQGKFFWCEDDTKYYLTVDDDIAYPSNYVYEMLKHVDRYDGKSIVGLHGSLLQVEYSGKLLPSANYRLNRTMFQYFQQCDTYINVHTLGTGVMACCPNKIGLTRAALGQPHTGDDEDIALFAQKHNVPMMKVPTKANWVQPMMFVAKRDPLHRRTGYIKTADEKMRAWTNWKLNSSRDKV